MSKNKKVCVRKVPHCKIYRDDDGSCEKCEKGFDLIPKIYLTKSQFVFKMTQCSLMINLQMKKKIEQNSKILPLFDSFFYINSTYWIVWREYSSNSDEFYFHHQSIKTKQKNFHSWGQIKSINFTIPNPKKNSINQLQKSDLLSMWQIKLFPNGNILFTNYDSQTSEIILTIHDSNFTQIFFKHSLVVSPPDLKIQIFNNLKFLVLYSGEKIYHSKCFF